MPAAALPLNEEERLRALKEYAVLDTPAHPLFDDIVAVVRYIFGTPTAMISLVDEKRQWFLARRGEARAETPREQAFCAHTILDTHPLVVCDARADPRFADNPMVLGEPRIRFYAGAPLITPTGHEIGALCAVSGEPGALIPAQVEALEALARQVVANLELRRVSDALASALSRARSLGHLLPICAWCQRIRDDSNYWKQVESYLAQEAGTEFSHSICPECEAKHFPR